jgi:hypothetical protein
MLDAKVVGSCANTYLDAGAANVPGDALAHGFASKLRGARRLPLGTIHVPIVASSQGGVHESLPLLYKKLAGLWQSQGDGRDGSTEGLQAQWLAYASTSLQLGQFCLIQRLIAGVARRLRRGAAVSGSARRCAVRGRASVHSGEWLAGVHWLPRRARCCAVSSLSAL